MGRGEESTTTNYLVSVRGARRGACGRGTRTGAGWVSEAVTVCETLEGCPLRLWHCPRDPTLEVSKICFTFELLLPAHQPFLGTSGLGLSS